MKKVGVSMDWFKSSRGKKTEDYEKDYLARYKKGEKSKPKKKTSKQKKTLMKQIKKMKLKLKKKSQNHFQQSLNQQNRNTT